METVTFEVPNISCGHCVATIQRVVKDEVPGVAEVKGDVDTKRVTVEFGPPATIEAIVASMTEWDYPPRRA
ncbi:MAG: heavy-metal-associated domain-containing protein [Anaerolineae bacterium]